MEFEFEYDENEKYVPKYDIKPHEVLYQHSDFKLYDDFYSDLFFNFRHLIRRIFNSRNQELIGQLEIEYYEPDRHFHFVDMYEEHTELMRKDDYKMLLIKGYCFENHKFKGVKHSGLFGEIEIESEFWEAPIKKVIKKELPQRIKNNTRENTIEFILLPPKDDLQEYEKEIEFQLGRHALKNPRIFDSDVEEAFRWTEDIIHFRHSHIILKNNHSEDNELFMYFFALTLTDIQIDKLYDCLLYNFKENFKSDIKYFSNKVKMVCWKYKSKFMPNDRIEYIYELLADISKETNNSNQNDSNEQQFENTFNSENNSENQIFDITKGFDCPEYDRLFTNVRVKNEIWQNMIDLKMINESGIWQMGESRSFLFAFIGVLKKYFKIPQIENYLLVKAFTIKIFNKNIRIGKTFKSEQQSTIIEQFFVPN